MSFRAGGRGISSAAGEVEVDDQALERWLNEAPGDVVVMLSPVDSLSVIIARLAQALAIRGRFPIEHASEILNFVAVVAGQTPQVASKPWIAASLRAGETGVGFAIGPVRPGLG